MKRFALALTGGIIVLSTAFSSQASTAQVAAGHATLQGGTTLELSISNAQNIAMLYNNVTQPLQITFTCVDEQSFVVPYPIPQFLNALYASGTGSDGRSYWMTIFDSTSGTDKIKISTEPGTNGACHGPTGTEPISGGDIVVAGA